MGIQEMRNLRLEGKRRTLCSPHTAGRVFCPAEINTKGQGFNVAGEEAI